jgi:hypothetical protein
MIAAAAGSRERALHPLVLRVVPPEHPSGVSRDQDRLDDAVQPVQIDVGQARGENPAI